MLPRNPPKLVLVVLLALVLAVPPQSFQGTGEAGVGGGDDDLAGTGTGPGSDAGQTMSEPAQDGTGGAGEGLGGGTGATPGPAPEDPGERTGTGAASGRDQGPALSTDPRSVIGETVHLTGGTYGVIQVPVPSYINVKTFAITLQNTRYLNEYVGALSGLGGAQNKGYVGAGAWLYRFDNSSGSMKWLPWGTPPGGVDHVTSVAYPGDGTVTTKVWAATLKAAFLVDNSTATPKWYSLGKPDGAPVRGIASLGSFDALAMVISSSKLYRMDNTSGTPVYESWGKPSGSPLLTGVTRSGDSNAAVFVSTLNKLYLARNQSLNATMDVVWSDWGSPPDGKPIRAVSGHRTTEDRVLVATEEHLYAVDNRTAGGSVINWTSLGSPADLAYRYLTGAAAVGDLESVAFTATSGLLYRLTNATGEPDWACWGGRAGMQPAHLKASLGTSAKIWAQNSFLGRHKVFSGNTTPSIVGLANNFLEQNPPSGPVQYIPVNLSSPNPVSVHVVDVNVTYNLAPSPPTFKSHAGVDHIIADHIPYMPEATIHWDCTDPEDDVITSFHVKVGTHGGVNDTATSADILDNFYAGDEQNPPRTNISFKVQMGKTYHWAVRAYDGTTWGGWSPEWNFSINQPPPVPEPTRDLGYRLDPESTYFLSWEKVLDTDDTLVTYRVEWRQGEGDWTVLYWGADATVKFEPANVTLETGVPYQWRVASWDGHEMSDSSEPDEFAFNSAPDRPANLRPGLNSGFVLEPLETVRLEWNDCTTRDYPSNDTVKYTVLFGYGEFGEPSEKIGENISARNWTVTPPLEREGWYTWRVSATDGRETVTSFLRKFNVTFPKEVVEVLLLNSTLQSPRNGTSVPTRFVTLSWWGEGADEMTYDVYLWESGADSGGVTAGNLIADFVSGTSHTVGTALEDGLTYAWTVIPRYGKEAGKCLSGVWTFTVDVSVEYPEVELVSPWDTQKILSGTVTLEWRVTEGKDLDVRFDVYLGTSPFPKNAAATGVTKKRVTVDSLTNGTTYYWRVVPFTDKAMGETSETWSFSVDLTFRPRYLFNVSADRDELKVVKGTTGTVNVTVENAGNVVDAFYLDVKQESGSQLEYGMTLDGSRLKEGEDIRLTKGSNVTFTVEFAAPLTNETLKETLFNFTVISVSGGPPGFVTVGVEVVEKGTPVDPDGEDPDGGDGSGDGGDGDDPGGITLITGGEGGQDLTLYLFIGLLILLMIVGIVAIHSTFQRSALRRMQEMAEEEIEEIETEEAELRVKPVAKATLVSVGGRPTAGPLTSPRGVVRPVGVVGAGVPVKALPKGRISVQAKPIVRPKPYSSPEQFVSKYSPTESPYRVAAADAGMTALEEQLVREKTVKVGETVTPDGKAAEVRLLASDVRAEKHPEDLFYNLLGRRKEKEEDGKRHSPVTKVAPATTVTDDEGLADGDGADGTDGGVGGGKGLLGRRKGKGESVAGGPGGGEAGSKRPVRRSLFGGREKARGDGDGGGRPSGPAKAAGGGPVPRPAPTGPGSSAASVPPDAVPKPAPVAPKPRKP